MLKIADTGPGQALPGRHVPRQDVRMKNDQVEHEENEEEAQEAANVAKDYLSVLDDQTQREVDQAG